MSAQLKLESNIYNDRDNLTIKKSVNFDNNNSESAIYDDDYIHQNKKQLKKEYKDKAFDYYKVHGNLNEFMYSTDNQDIRNKLEKWMKIFYNKSINDKKTSANSKVSFDDDKTSKLINKKMMI